MDNDGKHGKFFDTYENDERDEILSVRGPVVEDIPVFKFKKIKAKRFYRYLSPTFMKEFKNVIKLYNAIAGS